MSPAPEHHSESVYRRLPNPGSQPNPPDNSLRARTRAIAPAITPLIIGSLILLGLILGLGWWSVKQMDDVSFNARDLGIQHSGRLTLLLTLRLQVTQLDNEARARHQAESRRELMPPFEVRLGGARDKVKNFMIQLSRPPLSEQTEWIRLNQDLKTYVNVTEDLTRYSQEGFEKFKAVDDDLNRLLATIQQDQGKIDADVTARQQKAKRSIQLWSSFALLFGALVMIGTIWEVQRRFRETRDSMLEARRERIFTNQLVEAMVSAIAAIDEEDKIRSANAAFLKIFPGATIGRRTS